MEPFFRRCFGNPSSLHAEGQAARDALEVARKSVLETCGAGDFDLVFCSSGTEADNAALIGSALKARGHVVTSAVEHPAVLGALSWLEELGGTATVVGVDRDGRVDPAHITEALRAETSLVSLQAANNETGALQPCEEVGRRAHEQGVLFHTDATQAVGKIPVDVKVCGVDFLTCSAHKFHGPKGIGTLYARTGARLRWRQFGGSQERDRRGGTENVAGIVGMGTAAELAGAFVADRGAAKGAEARRDRFEDHLVRVLPGSVVHAHAAPRLWNTTNIGFANVAAEAILIALSEKGVCASAGAACSSGSLEPSPILLAMGIPESLAHGSVRFSLSRFTDDDEIDQAIQIVPSIVQRLARILPLGADDR